MNTWPDESKDQHDSPEAAAEALLLDVCRLLTGLDFIVVGGWVPYFRAEHPVLVHPGTRDVDVLFRKDQATLENAVSRFLDAGYLISAKHRFQLLKTMRVRDKTLVFNVDLLHPLGHGVDIDMQHDIIELDIPDGSEANGKMRMKSICFSASDIVFNEDLWSYYPLGGIQIPLMDGVGSVLSKCKSVAVSKRERDSFDQYLSLTGATGGETLRRFLDLSKKYEEIGFQSSAFLKHLKANAVTFDRNVRKYASQELVSSPAEELIHLLDRPAFN